MKLLKAKVTSTLNPSNNMTIPAELLREKEPINVFYTSPFNSILPGQGGFTAYPRKGDVILVATTDDGSAVEYFYISTIIGSALGHKGALPNYPKGSTKFLTGNSYKDTVGIRDHHDGGIEFVYENSEGGDLGVTRRNYAEFYAGSNKIKLGRSSSTGGVLLQTGTESPRVVLKMSGQKNIFGQGPNAFVVKSYGNMILKSTIGEITISNSVDGNTINIQNKAKRDVDGSDIFNPFNKKKGDILLESWHNTVNINANAANPLAPEAKPAVFVRTNPAHGTGVVQLKTGGRIEIVSDGRVANVGVDQSSGKIMIWASNGIDIHAETGDINISAPGGKVNLQPVTPAGAGFIPKQDNKNI